MQKRRDKEKREEELAFILTNSLFLLYNLYFLIFCLSNAKNMYKKHIFLFSCLLRLESYPHHLGGPIKTGREL